MSMVPWVCFSLCLLAAVTMQLAADNSTNVLSAIFNSTDEIETSTHSELTTASWMETANESGVPLSALLLGDSADYLKETTKIVTIKIYPPPAKGAEKNASSPEAPSVRIPQPFDMGGAVQLTTPASTTTTRPDEVSTVTTMEKPQERKVEPENNGGGFTDSVLPAAKEITVDFNALCRDGAPFVVDGSPLYCTLNSGCPPGYWCHTGSSKSYTFCCPNAQMDNGCNLAVSPGNGDGRMERWYFDANDSICKLFIYTGYGGNQNNFLTNQDCVDICGLRLNRATIPAPEAKIPVHNQMPQPPSAWEQAPSISSEKTTKTQQTAPARFSSSPFGRITSPSVATSRIVTPVSLAPLIPQPPSWGTVLQSSADRTLVNQSLPAPAVFPTGKVVPAPVTVSPKANVEASIMARCRDVVNHIPKANRKSTALETRWYYDYVLDACKSFQYAGHETSSNNFGSEYECNYHCRVSGKFLINPSTQATTTPAKSVDFDRHANTNPCDLPPNAGHGYHHVTRWYFDPEERYCREFFYSGQGGNANNFENEEQCLFACVLLMPKQQRGDPCELPIAQGRGTAALTRFYFNQWSGQCETFLYTGEGGNRNNFYTLQECRITCPDRKYSTSTSRPRQTTPERVSSPRPTRTLPTRPTTTTTQTTTTTTSTTTTPVPDYAADETTYAASPSPLLWEETGWPEIYNPFSGSQSTTVASTSTTSSPDGRVHPCKGVALAEYTYCGPYNNYHCPSGMYCHVGSTAFESVCCPTRGKSQTINVCSLPVDPGSGSAQLTRWYFNGQTGQCEMFLYKGTKGNQNNFLTHDMCKENCATNPCGVGTPYQVNNQNVQCSTLQQSVCPETHYCHVGGDVASSVCCPRHGNPCVMPISIGTGKAQLQRWAYSSVTRSCQTFIYTGMAGNENNFITEADCIGTCQAHLAPSMNPCSSGQPAQAANGVEFIYCSTSNLNGCPANHYCHVGGSPETTLCCPLAAGYPSPCQLPLNTGTGSTALSRWYFDMVSSTCKPFVYTGMSGNENNFLSMADCRQTCPEFDNPCPGGTPPVSPATGQVTFCSAINANCPPTYWCHVGADKQTSVCCPYAANPCSMPRVEGMGRHQLQRFYYDQNAKQCRTFIYSGASGNQNNFLSLAECEAACPTLDNPCSLGMPASGKDGNPIYCSTSNQDVCPPTNWCHIGSSASTTLCCPGAGDPCQMPPAKGAGTSVFNRWHYNNNTKTCVSFTYSGRGGNQNNFLSLAECRNACPEYKSPCSTGQPHIGLRGRLTRCGANGRSTCPVTYWCHVGASEDTSVCCPGAGDPCELPLAVGNGVARLQRYYYNRDTQVCQEFSYSGAGGNENNFLSLRDCEQRCPVFRNPCSTGQPLRNAQGQTTACSVQEINNACPSGYWCHVGMDEQSTVCCPKSGDPCGQNMQTGNGTGAIQRFYYNRLAEQCLPFTYSGLGGNENNFLSRADCERVCPVFESPCAQGDPATSSDGQKIYCTATDPHVCPSKHWCHIGDSRATSVCCPGEELACQVPAAIGNGVAVMTRWHFDIVSRACIRFTYSGKGGNANNFLTMQDCIIRCLSPKDVCSSSAAPRYHSAGASIRTPMYCNAFIKNSCPTGFWCHVGASAETTVCCPGANDPCTLPMTTGQNSEGDQSLLLRWYYDRKDRTCKQFQYAGAGGNQNNFLSLTECHERCADQKGACPRGDPYRDPVSGQPIRCSPQNPQSCPPQFSCDPESTVCCPRLHVARSSIGEYNDPTPPEQRCQLPLDAGVGIFALPRWYFDATERECRQFSYSGTGGNENNFLSKDECQKLCSGPDPCTMPKDAGAMPGERASEQRWYFDSGKRKCRAFAYSGANGNGNNFRSPAACRSRCLKERLQAPINVCAGEPYRIPSGQVLYCDGGTACPSGYFCHFGNDTLSTMCCPSAGEDPCTQRLAAGTGHGQLTRWYYDTASEACTAFVYSGIRGNENNFRSVEECQERCTSGGINPDTTTPCARGAAPFMDISGSPLQCVYEKDVVPELCPPDHFCHVGTDAASTVCCPIEGEICDMPKSVGHGTKSVQRWHFDSSVGLCTAFAYSGLGGNANNFRSEKECLAACAQEGISSPDAILASPQNSVMLSSFGQCPHGEPLITRNGHPQECSKDPTIPSAVFCPHTYACFLPADSDNAVCCPDPKFFCAQEISVGTNLCQSPVLIGAGQRYGYDATTGTCIPFFFEGCGGNLNNFATYEHCVRICITELKGSADSVSAADQDSSSEEGAKSDVETSRVRRRPNFFSTLFSLLRKQDQAMNS